MSVPTPSHTVHDGRGLEGYTVRTTGAHDHYESGPGVTSPYALCDSVGVKCRPLRLGVSSNHWIGFSVADLHRLGSRWLRTLELECRGSPTFGPIRP